MTLLLSAAAFARVADGMSGAGRMPPRTRAISPSLQPSSAPGPKRDRFVLPGGVERRQVVGVRIGQSQQRRDFIGLRRRPPTARPARRNTAS